MSSGGQIAGAVVSAVVGFFAYGGPAGAAYGAVYGAALGAALDPPKGPTIQGPRLSDLTVQTSTYGSFLPRFYGTAPAHGNVFWLEGGKLKEVVRKKKQGGKGGGGGSTMKTYTYFATFAIGLGEGPIAGVRRIWCRDKLIYNVGSSDLETIIASNKAARGWRIYNGSDDQLPDPRIEAEKGVGNTPAYRGTPYIVFYDFELTEYNNSLEGAQFKFEVCTEISKSTEASNYRFIESPGNFLPGAVYGYLQSDSEASIFDPNWSNSYPSSASAVISESREAGVVSRKSAWSPTGTIIPNPSQGKICVSSVLPSDSLYIYPDKVSIDITNRIVEFFVVAGGYLFFSGEWNSVSGMHRVEYSTFTPSNISIASQDYLSICENDSKIYCLFDGGIDVYDYSLNLLDTISVDADFSTPSETSVIWMNFDGVYLYLATRVKVQRLSADLQSVEKEFVFSDISPSITGNYTAGVFNGVFCRGGYVTDSPTRGYVHDFHILETVNRELVPISYIFKEECKLTSLLNDSDVSTDLMTDGVRGYRVQGGTVRASIENLQAAYPFDVRQHGYLIQCVPRGGSSVATIPHEDLGAASGESASETLRQSREMDSQLPASTHLKFWDASREYASGEEYADRPGTQAVNRVDRELPIVLTATEAAQAADVLQQLPWLERTVFDLEIPPIYAALEPADVVTVTTPESTYTLRLTEINDASTLVRKCKARPANAAIYKSQAVGGDGGTPPDTIGLAGPSLFIPLDIPLVDEVSQTSPGFVGVMTGYSEGWPGAIAVRSTDGGQTFEDIQGFTGKATIGLAQNSLSAHAGYLISSATLTLSVISGEFYSITEDQLLTGFNYAAYGVDGRWEIVRFRDATLNADGTYTLSGFVRGDKGTEWATGLHQVGDYFILLDDPDNAFIGMSIQSIGLDRIYRGVTSGASIDDAEDVTFSYDGVNLEPLGVVNVTGARDGSQNFTGSFYRRSRLSSTWWTNGVQAPVGETSEAYAIDVMNGSTVVRTISSSTTSFSYTAAQQTTDFGSAQASITFRIYQLSEVVGRGYVREVTL